MKQFNKQTRKLNTNALNDYILELEQKERNKKRETGFLIVLILIGFSGLYYIFSHAQPDSNFTIDHSDLDEISASLVQASMRTKTQVDFITSPSSNRTLLINGTREAHVPIAFIVDSYDAKASYTLFFGDGKTEQIRNKHNYHTYDSPGNYDINLKVTFNGVTKNIYSGKIKVANNIEIAEGAEREFY